VKSAESKRTSLVANLGDFNRPLRVRPVRYMGREWWAIDAEDIWPGIVMDLRRLGFESVAFGEDVLVRESTPSYEPMMIGPAAPGGLKPFPTLHPTIRVRKDIYLSGFTNLSKYSDYDAEDFEEDVEDESEFEDLEVLDEQEEND
jgi:hypothetical protein